MKNFFRRQTAQSLVKAQIVAKYFSAWAKIMASKAHSGEMAYIDLYAGPGVYSDRSPSTPVMILERALENEKVCRGLHAVFNDSDAGHARQLEETIAAVPGIERFTHPPRVLSLDVDELLAAELEATSLMPSLFFVDPYGYKGVSMRLIAATTKDFGSDCIMFFNYNRVQAALSNPKVETHMVALFGDERLRELRTKVGHTDRGGKEAAVLEALLDSLSEHGADCTHPFAFRSHEAQRTSHYLIFVSKSNLGYKIMKDIMAKLSTSEDGGISDYEFVPAAQQVLFPSQEDPLAGLRAELRAAFAGRILTVRELFEEHHVGTPYRLPNYQDALRQLEEQGIIKCDPRASERPMRSSRVTFAEGVRISFPQPQGGGDDV